MALSKKIPVEKGGTNAITAPDALTNLGAEAVANKENSTINTSTTKYPTVNLLKTGLDLKVDKTVLVDMKDPTGFVSPDDITVSYDSIARTITLTQAGGIEYYWHGTKHTLASPWTSDPHNNTTDGWFLKSTDGTNFVWSTTEWEFFDVMVSYRPEGQTFAVRECHALMDWQAHHELHNVIGTYLESGLILTPGTYEVQPAVETDTKNTPGWDSGSISDEDLPTAIAAVTEGDYTTLYFTATGTVNFDTTATTLYRKGVTFPKINSVSGGTFSETETVTGRYFNYYAIHIPVTADAGSQPYRTVILQPQNAYTSLEAAQGEDYRSLNLGDFATLSPEFVAYARITLRTNVAYTTDGKVRIEAVDYLTGSRASQVAVTGFNPTNAENVSFTPAGNLSSTNVEAALIELDDEKAPALTSDQNYVSDAELSVLQNTSNTNTGDETTSRIETLLNTVTPDNILTLVNALKPYFMDYQQLTVTKQHAGAGGGGNETQLFQVTGQVEYVRLSAIVTTATNSTTFNSAGWKFIDSVGNNNDITRCGGGFGVNMNGTAAEAGVYKFGASTADATYWNSGNARVIEGLSQVPWILQKEVGRDCFICWRWTGDASTDVTMEHSILWRPLDSTGNVVAV